MSGRFFDTNILIHALSPTAKGEVARHVLGRGGAISVQVLNEFVNVSHRKYGKNWREIGNAKSQLCRSLIVHPLSEEAHEYGCAMAQRYRLSVYDAMIAGSAFVLGCDVLFTEEMQDGLVLDGRLTVANPFRDL